MLTWVSAGVRVTYQIREFFLSRHVFFCKYFEHVSLCYKKLYYFAFIVMKILIHALKECVGSTHAERKFPDFCALLLYWYNIFRSGDDDVGKIDPGEPAHQIKLFSFRPRCPQRYLSTTISWKLAFHIFTKTSNLPILLNKVMSVIATSKLCN